MRWGFRPCLRHTRATIMWLTPKCSASRRVLQCVVPSLGPRRVASRTRASSCGVSTVASWPRCRLYSPASRCSSKRRVQLATKPRLQGTRSHASSHVWPSANSKIKRARRASSARPVRLAARRSSSIRSTFVSSMASLMDAIIVYTWLLQSTSHSPRPSAPPREASRRVQLFPVRLLSPQHGAERAEHLIDLRRLDDERRGERDHIPALAPGHAAREAPHEHVEGSRPRLAGDRLELDSEDQSVVAHVDDVRGAAQRVRRLLPVRRQ